MKKFIFTITILGMAAGCTPDNLLPVEILDINLSPTSGFTTTCIAEIDAKGTDQIEVLWFNRYDSTGWHGITFENLYIDGEGIYRSILNLAPDSLEYYYQVIICDSAGTELAKSDEVFYGDGPTGSPEFSFTAYPREGQAPLWVRFMPSFTNTKYIDEWTWDPEGTGDYIWFNIVDMGWQYTKPGLYTVSMRCMNRWGTTTVTEPDMIEVWE